MLLPQQPGDPGICVNKYKFKNKLNAGDTIKYFLHKSLSHH